MDHASRWAALTGSLEHPLLVTRLPNIRYLTGFTGSAAYLLAEPDGRGVFVTDGRYAEAVGPLLSATPGIALEVAPGPIWDTLELVLGGRHDLALEAHGVTWEFQRTLVERTGLDPVPAAGRVEDLRRSKGEDEVDSLSAAARIGDLAFGSLRDLLGGPVSERDLAWALVGEMRRHGGTPADWDPIVAVGPGGSIPHYESGDSPVESGMMLLDYGCLVEGYHGDMSRTVWLGDDPDPELERVHRAVAAAEQAGIAAVAPGVACHDVDEAVREVLRGYGYEEFFLHSTGHGVGLEIHEAPWLRRNNDDLLRAGDVVTIEPGVYLAGRGGVRIEDMVLVGEEGPVVLTGSPRGMMLS